MKTDTPMAATIAEFENRADGVSAIVSKTPRGWSVVLRDDDSGEYLGAVRTYPHDRQAAAIEYAKRIAAGAGPAGAASVN